MEKKLRDKLHIISIFIIWIGYILSVYVWSHEHDYISILIGCIFVIGTCCVVKKEKMSKKKMHIFQHYSIPVISLFIFSILFNGILFHVWAPYPLLTDFVYSFLGFLVVWSIFNIGMFLYL